MESPDPCEAEGELAEPDLDLDAVEAPLHLPPPTQVPLLAAPPQDEEASLQLPAPTQVILLPPPPPRRPALADVEQAAMVADVDNSKRKRALEEAEPLSYEDGPVPPSERAQVERTPAPARVTQTSAVRASSSSSTSSSTLSSTSRRSSKSGPSEKRVEGATGAPPADMVSENPTLGVRRG